MAEVLSEIKALIERGVTEITLLGQNVNSYKYGLADLLRGISKLLPLSLQERGSGGEFGKGVRVQFLSSHPRDMSDEIIRAVAERPYVVKDFVLPLQSGDNEILRRMNRGYTYEYYIDRVKKIRSLIPAARISTDLMVGFPGESEAQFLNTMKALEEIKFRDVHMFAYSARPTTAAAKLPDQLSEEVKQERLKRLIELNRQLLSR
jgi:tRNA-2-methylthio-N6-dimethylallyladenosine synthase